MGLRVYIKKEMEFDEMWHFVG